MDGQHHLNIPTCEQAHQPVLKANAGIAGPVVRHRGARRLVVVGEAGRRQPTAFLVLGGDRRRSALRASRSPTSSAAPPAPASRTAPWGRSRRRPPIACGSTRTVAPRALAARTGPIARRDGPRAPVSYRPRRGAGNAAFSSSTLRPRSGTPPPAAPTATPPAGFSPGVRAKGAAGGA